MERPTSVTVFGILNIVFAALGLVGLLMTMALFSQESADTRNPVIKLIHDNQTYAAWMKISAGLGLAACAVLLVAGIGLLALKPWARVVSIGYSIYTLLMTGAGMVINYIYLVQPLLEQARQKQGPEATAAFAGAIGGMLGGCIGVVYPILLIIFMMRRNVVEAFRRPTP